MFTVKLKNHAGNRRTILIDTAYQFKTILLKFPDWKVTYYSLKE